MKKLMILFAAMVTLAAMSACKSGDVDLFNPGVEEVEADFPAWDAIYSNRDTISCQYLMVRFVDDTLFYQYSIDLGCSFCFDGQAILKNGDSEIDEDENGVAYPVDEYVSDGEEYLAFRFDADSHTRVRIVMDDETAAKCKVPMPIVLFPNDPIAP